MITITNNEILLDGKPSGYGVAQLPNRTRVYRRHGGEGIAMPHLRYSLTTARPASGTPGLDQFESDLRRLFAASWFAY